MPRINLSLDLSNNDIIPQEIEKAIKAAVKSKTREFFHETLEEELERIADKTANDWKYRSPWSSKPNRTPRSCHKRADRRNRLQSKSGKSVYQVMMWKWLLMINSKR